MQREVDIPVRLGGDEECKTYLANLFSQLILKSPLTIQVRLKSNGSNLISILPHEICQAMLTDMQSSTVAIAKDDSFVIVIDRVSFVRQDAHDIHYLFATKQLNQLFKEIGVK